MRIEVKNITPEMAGRLLERNFNGNRPIVKSHVEQLADVMRRGQYDGCNGETIKIGEDDGVLYDGQHRLSAIVASGCSQKMIVVFVNNGEKSYLTIDNGARRRTREYMSKFENASTASGYAGVMACVEWGTIPLATAIQSKIKPQQRIARDLVLRYADMRHDAVQEAATKARAMRNSVGCGSQVMFAAFIGIVRYVHRAESLDKFIKEFTAEKTDSDVVYLSQKSIMREGAKGRIENTWLLGTLFQAYENYRSFGDVVRLNKASDYMNRYARYIEAERAERNMQRGGEAV